ncbi:MAG: magnesium transporter [Candidatus Magasanikbacteria bacterium]|nr:magnesium transporter [Candidatus Magasanikbacteria bacterium]
MLFFSNILGGEVRDQADTIIGKVHDVVIKINNEGFPSVFAIQYVDKRKDKKMVHASEVETFGKNYITLKNIISDVTFLTSDEKGLVFLRETVLDRQIVDMAGVRVVRVNDLQLGMVKGLMCLVALDIGKLGLLRRLGFGASKLFSFLQPELLEWKNVKLLGDKLQLSMSGKELVKLHPADIANIIEKLNLNQGSELLQVLDKKTAAQVLEELEPELQKILVQNLGSERAASVMQKMSIDELVDLIQMLPDYKSKEIMQNLPSDSKQKVRTILEYNEDTAGGLMTTEYISAVLGTTVQEVVEEIKKSYHMHRGIYFVYVTDEDNFFKGVVSVRKLLVSERNQTMKELIDVEKKITATVGQTVSEIAILMTKYNLTALAVLDEEEKLLGVITVDDVMRHFVPHA